MQGINKTIPKNFEAFAEELVREAEDVEGFLSPNEMLFLALVSAVPTAVGEVLEIGSFKGRSTIVLARAAELAGDSYINAVDPMTAPSSTDPDLKGSENSFEDFSRNIAEHGVADKVRLHRILSHELAAEWSSPLRLLWIDGDHTYEGTKRDLESFRPFLCDRAIVAFHDVLHEFEGGLRVFMEDVLLSPHFGAAGFCGSIAWSQFREDPTSAERYRDQKLRLYRKLARMVPLVAFGQTLGGMRKKLFKLYRWSVPHGAIDPRRWLVSID